MFFFQILTMCNYAVSRLHKFLNCAVPGFVCQAVQCGWADGVSVVKGFELIVSQPLLSENRFQFDLDQ